MKRFTAYLQSAWTELGKVVWPTPQQAVRLTLIVIGFSLVFGVLIGAIDLGFKQLLQKIILKG